ncbi:MAG: hypothetical protein U0599_21020 [Vicinamibacteria bacterium]
MAAALAQQVAEVEVRLEVVGVDRELGLERLARPGPVAALVVHQALAVQEVRERQLRARVEGAADERLRLRAVRVAQVHHREEHLRFRRVVAQHAVDRGLRVAHPPLRYEGHPEQVRHRAVLRRAAGERLQQVDDPLRLAQAEQAVGEEEARRLVLRLREGHRLGLAGRVLHAAGLVEGEGEVAADRDVGAVLLEGAPVLVDRVVVAAEGRVRRAEVRAQGRVVEAGGERLLVGRRRAGDVALLLQPHGLGEERGGIGRGEGRRRSGRLQEEEESGGREEG